VNMFRSLLTVFFILIANSCSKIDNALVKKSSNKIYNKPLDTPFPWKDLEFTSSNANDVELKISSLYLISSERGVLPTKMHERLTHALHAHGVNTVSEKAKARYFGVLNLQHSIATEKVRGYRSRHSFVKYLEATRTIKYAKVSLELSIYRKDPESNPEEKALWVGLVSDRIRSTWVLSEFDDGKIKKAYTFTWHPSELVDYMLNKHAIKEKSQRYSYLELDYFIYSLMRDLGRQDSIKAIKIHPKLFRYASQEPERLLFQLPDSKL
jgi:hypothetical protein